MEEFEKFQEFEYKKNRPAKVDLIKKNIAGTIDAIIIIIPSSSMVSDLEATTFYK